MPKTKKNSKKARLARLNTQLSRLFGVVLVLILILGFLINLIMPDKSYSNAENRVLAARPSLGSITSSDFGTEVDTWYTDQFAGRSAWLHSAYLLKKTLGIREIDDVYLGKGQLLMDPYTPDQDVINANTSAMNAFAKAYPDVRHFAMIVPTAASIQSNKLPGNAPVEDEKEIISQIYLQTKENLTNVDAYSALEAHSNEYIYYKTDHHWTSLGAYYGIMAALGSMDRQLMDLDEFNIMPVSTSFEGTLANKTGSVGLKDTISIYVASDNPDYIVNYESMGVKSSSIYDSSALDQKDQYQVFLGANTGLIHIECLNDSDKHLLLFKDSYANSTIQFLLPYFRSITIVDPRYYYEDAGRLIDSYLITDVMYLYNYNNFVSDSTLADSLNSALADDTVETTVTNTDTDADTDEYADTDDTYITDETYVEDEYTGE